MILSPLLEEHTREEKVELFRYIVNDTAFMLRKSLVKRLMVVWFNSGTSVPIPIDASKVTITKIKLDKNRKELLEKKAKK